MTQVNSRTLGAENAIGILNVEQHAEPSFQDLLGQYGALEALLSEVDEIALRTYAFFADNGKVRAKARKEFTSSTSSLLDLASPKLAEILPSDDNFPGFIDVNFRDDSSVLRMMPDGFQRLYAIWCWAIEYRSKFNKLSILTHEERKKVDIIVERLSVEIGSIQYRMMEYYYLMLGAILNDDRFNDLDDEVKQGYIDRSAGLNAELYGAVDQEEENQTIGELLYILRSGNPGYQDSKLFEELQDALVAKEGDLHRSIDLNDYEQYSIPSGLTRKEALRQAREILEDNRDAYEIINDYYINTILNRKNNNEKYFTPDDLKIVFELIEDQKIEKAGKLSMSKDNPNILRIAKEQRLNIEIDPDSTQTVWVTTKNAIVIGGQRDPVSSPEVAFGIYWHEGSNHGETVQKGREFGPIFGAGVMRSPNVELGQVSDDFLTQEEGIGALGQSYIDLLAEEKKMLTKLSAQEISQEELDDWYDERMTVPSKYLLRTLPIILAQKGYNSRQVHEVVWRIMALLEGKNGQDQVENKNEYDEIKDSAVKNYVTRIFRGTNPSKDYRDSSGRALHFGKDGSYARGLRDALKIMRKNNWTINTLHKKYAVVRSSLRSRGKRFKGILKNGLTGLLQN